MANQDLVDQMLDRESIRNVHVLYCHYIATKNHNAFLDLFTDDARYVFEGEAPLTGTFVGRAEISTVFMQAAEHDFWPLAAGHAIFLAGPTNASGTAYSQVWDGKTDPRAISISIYNDKYVKVAAAQWRISERIYNAIKINS